MIFKDILSYIKLPDYFTLAGLVAGIGSIFCSINNNFIPAAFLIFVAAFFDFFDGKIARIIKRKDKYGAELDNLCDTISFLVAVSVFGYQIGLKTNFAIFIFIFFISAGVLRLSRFAMTGTVKGYYIGVPVTASVIIPLTYLIFTKLTIDTNYLIWFYVAHALLMISSIKIKKL